MDNVKETKNILSDEQKKINEEVYAFFSDFIQKGKVYKSGEVAPGFFVKLRALNTEEVMEAESVVINMSDNLIVADIGVRIRSCSILSYAIEVLGDNEIYSQDEILKATEEDKKSASFKRAAMYNNLLKLPPQLLEKMYAMYLEAVKEQNAMYNDPKQIEDKSENFSNHPSEK